MKLFEVSKLFKVTSLFVVPLVIPMFLLGCSGGSDTPPGDSPAATSPEVKSGEAKPEDAKAEDGKVHTFKEVGLQFTVPEDWKVETETENGIKSMTIDSPKGDVSMVLMAVNQDKVEAALSSMRGSYKGSTKNYKEDAQETKTINGMKYKFRDATGDHKEGPMMLSAGHLEASKPVLITSVMYKDTADTFAPLVEQLMQSIKKL